MTTIVQAALPIIVVRVCAKLVAVIPSKNPVTKYETKTIAFRVRVEFVEPIKKMVKDYVSERLQGDA